MSRHYPIVDVPDTVPAGGGGLDVFDSPDALAINRARMDHLDSLELQFQDRSVLDAGCGVGHLAQFFVQRGCRVVCVDGRQENIERLQVLYPGLEAHVANVETDRLSRYGKFDVVLSYGLLYHLENPVAGLRNLADACAEILLIETVVSDHHLPLLRLEDEPCETPNQTLQTFGSRPTPAFVALLLKRLGFPFVYGPTEPPAHPDFQFEWLDNLECRRNGHLLRYVFVASRRELNSSSLVRLQPDPAANVLSSPGDVESLLREARHRMFLRPLGPFPGWRFGVDWDNPDPAYRARRELWGEFQRRCIEAPFEFEWYDGLRLHLYLGNDLSRQLFISGCADPNEFAVLDKLLQPGMVVVDAGANDGLYTLFAARRVGNTGAVVAFEPSQREFGRLEQNLFLNCLENVRAVQCALGGEDGEAELKIAGGGHHGHNTLGSFAYEDVELLRSEHVPLKRLDTAAAEAGLSRLDFLKMDVEGSETSLLRGAESVLRKFRPVVLFEALDSALRKQGSSRDELLEMFSALEYRLYVFGPSGQPEPADGGYASENMIAIPREKPLPKGWCARAPQPAEVQTSEMEHNRLPFRPALAYWNQRHALASSRDRILALSRAVDRPSDCNPFQFAQLMAAAMDFRPDVILELGRGRGNSTCAFTEASSQCGGAIRIVSICNSGDWTEFTIPRLRGVVPQDWFAPLQIRREDILAFDYTKIFADAGRVLVFWDAHGFDIAECVLGGILPLIAGREHVILMHDLSDTRYASRDEMNYGPYGLWKGKNDWTGPRLKLGIVDSAVEQSIAALDFTTRNRLTFNSADHSIHTDLTGQQQSEMRALLGELFETQGHWFYFTMNEHPGPYTFPRFEKPSQDADREKKRWWR